MAFVLDFRTANTGGAVVRGVLTHGQEIDLQRHTAVTFLLHGFNVNRKDGTAKLTAFAESLKSVTDQALVAVLWPGDHWTKALSYSFEGKDADDTAKELARYVDLVLRPGTVISFVTHSLGARVAMETISRLRGKPFVIGQVCLMAPAVDDFCIAHPKVYRDACASSVRLSVLASRKDTVLKYAYPAGDLVQAFLFFSRDQSGLALGYHGPKPYRKSPVGANVLHEQIPDGRKAGHGDYLPDPGANPPANKEQQSAANYADVSLSGGMPRYV